MIFVIQTNDEVAGLDIDRALSLAGISCTIISKTRDDAAQQSARRTADNVATCPHDVPLGTHCHFCGDL